MKTLYFDCFAGASGDMILGALVSAGADRGLLLEQLKLLRLSNWEVDLISVDRSGMAALFARVRTGDESRHRHLGDILKIIAESGLPDEVKARGSRIFSRLAEAEARVHNIPVERVHFHEVGALDAIIDVIGASICFELLGIEKFVCSPLHVGSGMVEMAHGRFPVPPPAVVELLKGAPIYATDIAGELVTPTGAAIITTVCSDYGPLPAIELESFGYGAGSREYKGFPNVLRVMIGYDDSASSLYASEKLIVVETNIDDMSPRSFGHVMEMALNHGALDCYFTPVQMKKNRPGVLVSILCRRSAVDALCELLFKETTTLGLRTYEVDRRFLEREAVRVATRYGPIDVKVGRLGGKMLHSMPEYEQCRKAATKACVSVADVETAARESFLLMMNSANSAEAPGDR